MSIIWAIIIGFIVGLVAKFLMPGRDPGGFIITALLGIVGAVLASFLGQAMGLYAAGQSAGFIGAVIGAIVVLFIYNLVVRGRRPVV
ncbi:MAG: GlsB/YeaQ/YmgE family stress response membrane protein [Pseudomonadota bacterium]|nr:GlsB/YeaQ/YmgE family stress response membrane protein [Pseudomonadota bacterium]